VVPPTERSAPSPCTGSTSIPRSSAPEGQPLDGESLLSVLTGESSLDERSLFWHFPAYLEANRKSEGFWRTTPVGVVRRGPLKLLEFFEDGRCELYDLENDPGEAHDLAVSRPEDAAALHGELQAWRADVDAPVPTTPEPRYVTPVEKRERRPNVIYVLADDLGYGELGCYGQEKIRTPRLDRLAAEGLRFTQHYAGSPLCAPSRCVLMTGRHTGHAIVRNNSAWYRKKEKRDEGQFPLPAGTPTIASLLQQEGYATAAIGKWGLGGPDNSGEPNRLGFDHFFGYLCQAHAHDYYPDHLWRNGEKVALDNPDVGAHEKWTEPPTDPAEYARFLGRHYAPDLMIEEALGFVRTHAEEPFFLYFATPVPHAALQVPDEALADYPAAWDPEPYLGQKGYAPHPRPHAAYAAMITRLDAHVGRLLDLLDELGIADDTLVMFTSDNGPTYNGGADSEFFASAAGLRGLKGSVHEGGIRVPMIARWPGHIAAGKTTHHVSGFQDVLPTILDVVGLEQPTAIDGLSFAPQWNAGTEQAIHEHLYWELGGRQAVRAGKWKLVRNTNRKGVTAAQLFDLESDPNETTDLAAAHPEVLIDLLGRARRARTPSTIFPSPYDDGR